MRDDSIPTEEDLERWADIGKCAVHLGEPDEDCHCSEEARRSAVKRGVLKSRAALALLPELAAAMEAALVEHSGRMHPTECNCGVCCRLRPALGRIEELLNG